MEVKLSTRALRDLEKISLYTEEMWGDEQRIKTALQLKATVQFLEVYPDCGQSTDKSGVYVLIVPKLPFVYLYRIMSSKILILQILHSKQNRK